MSSYGDYLKSNGATAEEISVLDTPAAQRAFTKMQSDLSAATERATTEAQARVDYEAKVNKWHQETIVPEYQALESKVALAAADTARSESLIRTMSAQDAGLKEIAIKAGYKFDDHGTVTPPAAAAPAREGNSEYLTRKEWDERTSQVGDGLAALQDMVIEHAQLFPDKPLRVRELRAAATAAGKQVYQYWQDTYHVGDARAAREKSEKEAYEKKLRDEGASAEREKFASTYGNPDARPLVASNSPFTKRPDAGRDKQPWDADDRSNERVANATRKVLALPLAANR